MAPQEQPSDPCKAPPGDLPALIQGLLRPEAYPHAVGPGPIRLLQTHISWVLLTGDLAYKIKKPVNFGFVDFSSLERRRRCCHEEVRLNQRLNPGLYRGVVAIGGSPAHPRIPEAVEALAPCGGPTLEPALEPVLDYAVRMEQFPQEALLPAALERGSVSGRHVDRLADDLARFHAQAARADQHGPYGTPEAVLEPVLANITSLRRHGDPALSPQLERLHAWILASDARLRPRFAARLAAGHIRECHGDLHLGNLLLRRDAIEVFDGLEFNPGLRWIDPISDIAFLVMDLEERGQRQLGFRMLNRWLEQSGDYRGLDLWSWYVSYRALVRAKVAALAGEQAAVERYLRLAEHTAQPRPQGLVLCHGLSGSGKSHHSGRLLEELGAIRLRSDVERKRLFGLWGVASQDGDDPPRRRGDPYAAAVGEELFSRVLPELARRLLLAGQIVIVDATFLRRRNRRTMAAVAAAAAVPLVIVSCEAPQALLEERLRQRQCRGDDPSDADLAVLRQQELQREPLTAEEQRHTLTIGPVSAGLADAVRQRLRPRAPSPIDPGSV